MFSSWRAGNLHAWSVTARKSNTKSLKRRIARHVVGPQARPGYLFGTEPRHMVRCGRSEPARGAAVALVPAARGGSVVRLRDCSALRRGGRWLGVRAPDAARRRRRPRRRAGSGWERWLLNTVH